ncbi:MAG: pilus assembly PilX N-terminal domain-containing protein [Acidobacteriia bacterium]|nr:pilus assembly PilX N-terminal domain-containing protein [Terriglobia bacterium]
MMKHANQKGSALILAMILVLVLSVMAASMMFLSQSETWSSMNYRLMTQSRYGAEAGLNAAANYLIYSYAPPGTALDPLSAYDTTQYPVALAGTNTAVILSTFYDDADDAQTYPVAAVQTAFNSAAKGPLQAGTTPVTYDASAQLIAMRQVSVYGSPTPVTVQTWRITGRGGIVGLSNASVEVSAIMERMVSPLFGYAAFASSAGCGALNFGGGGTTNSYDSASLLANGGTLAAPVFMASGGNVGTNGNLNTVGSTTVINGTLSTPRVGTGTCSTGNLTAFSGSGSVSGGLVELPQPVTYPTPPAPNPMPPTGNLRLNMGTCTYIGCTGTAGLYALAPGTAPGTLPGPALYPDVIVQGVVHLSAGYYNMNSLQVTSAGATVIIDSGPVVLNVAGVGIPVSQAVVDFTGGSLSNPSLNPLNFQIQYAGTGLIKLAGGVASSTVLYAPNSSASITGGSDFYGSIITGQLTDMGGAAVHYDRRLQVSNFYVGNWMLDSFSWSKY